MKTSVFYYTNNVLSPKLLEYTLKETLKHCKNNNCELILTSHYPLTESYEKYLLGEESKPNNSIYNYIVQGGLLKDEETSGVDIKAYVVGRLPYSLPSIIRQLLFSIERCNSDYIILMEHDCLYPEDYIEEVQRGLGYGKDLTYCCFSNCHLNDMGYFQIDGGSLTLSTFGFKKDVLKKVYERKLELYLSNKKRYFEPVLDIDLSKIDPKAEEIIVNSHICVDSFMKHCGALDIKHHLNADGFLMAAEDKYFHYHPYWGEDTKYLEMTKDITIDEKNQKVWNYGLASLDY